MGPGSQIATYLRSSFPLLTPAPHSTRDPTGLPPPATRYFGRTGVTSENDSDYATAFSSPTILSDEKRTSKPLTYQDPLRRCGREKRRDWTRWWRKQSRANVSRAKIPYFRESNRENSPLLRHSVDRISLARGFPHDGRRVRTGNRIRETSRDRMSASGQRGHRSARRGRQQLASATSAFQDEAKTARLLPLGRSL